MEAVRKKARELLESGIVQVVIGYGNGTGAGVRAIFVQNAAEVENLLYDERCEQNLCVYLFKPEIKNLGKPALVAPPAALRTIAQLVTENQLHENDLVLLGVAPDGGLREFVDFKALDEYLAGLDDRLSSQEQEQIDKIEKLTPAERWQFWQDQLSRCFKCYACRAACPMCYCSRCTIECNQPQWVPAAAHELGNFEWHVMRAMHLAGRCINCGACARACPMDIPLNLLTQKLAHEAYKNFDYSAGRTGQTEYVLSSFKIDDRENFIR